MGILQDSCQLLFAGVNFVFLPPAEVTQERQLGFQSRLIDRKVEFDQSRREGSQVVLLRTLGSRLQVQIINPPAPVGQLLILAEQPQHPFEVVKKEMDEVVAAFEENWGQRQQIVARDASVRLLFATDDQHAFEYLWEDRLHQSEGALQALGRPVLGGGLRFVMPPGEEKFQIELKVESFLSDSTKLLLDTQCLWPEPEMHGIRMRPAEMVQQVYDYAKGPALEFALGDAERNER